ncbi:MAG TPA: cysteine--tRNA ligase [Egibacteraceae bacterium]|nr:cysteine--tRNA ligase [Egibacteraceae bacterium]
MAMRLFDTRTRTAHELSAGPVVRMYVCGITPYDSTHLGHAFTYVVFDALIRVLEHRGRTVRYVRNITDVDDDILQKARELGMDHLELARREVARFDRDLAGLGLRRPDVEPRATETVPAIVRAVRGLVDAGIAYPTGDGRVYVDTRKAEQFGRLSRLDREEALRQFAEKGGDPDAPGKREALDFLLWQPSAPDEPRWDSDFGPGRPGWHIECSVMAQEHLGPTIDIHGGGNDLVFPHHEAEIVQAEHLTGQAPFARFWVHTGMVAMDGEKMSKSLGNLVFVSDLLERFEAGALRRYLLDRHYRGDWAFADESLADSAAAYKVWRDAAGRHGRRPDLADAFHAALDDDFDTRAAIRVLDEAAAAGAGDTLRDLAGVLGFVLT